jgi:DNA-binding Xre family transcriptional regulator
MTLEAYKNMRIEYNRLFNKLKENKITQKDFRDNAGISGATMQKLLHNGNITTEIICRICDYFQCMPDEIMEFIPDSDYIEKQQAKQEVQQQIAELQAKLKQM